MLIADVLVLNITVVFTLNRPTRMNKYSVSISLATIFIVNVVLYIHINMIFQLSLKIFVLIINTSLIDVV